MELERIFAELNEKPLPYRQFWSEVGRIRAEHLDEIPPEISLDALLSILRTLQWISEQNGIVTLRTKSATQPEILRAERAAFA